MAPDDQVRVARCISSNALLAGPPSAAISFAGGQRHYHAREPALASTPGGLDDVSKGRPSPRQRCPLPLYFRGSKGFLVVPFPCFNRIGLMLGLFPSREKERQHMWALSAPECGTLRIWTSALARLGSSATHLIVERGCMPRSACRWISATWVKPALFFWGWRGRKKAWTASRSSRWRQWALVPGRTPYWEMQHSGGE